MIELHGFVNPYQIKCPDGTVRALAHIEAEHARSGTVLREIKAGRMRLAGDIKAAAEFMTNGAIELPRFDVEILDYVRRRGKLGQRISSRPSVGQPGRYFEQRTIVTGQFVDPRIIQNVIPGSPARSERYLTMKALAAQTNFGLFDVEVNRQQNVFNSLLAKDIEDMVMGTLKTSDKALWQGTDTDVSFPSTLEYVGGLTQINRTASVASNASVIDALKREVASIRADQDFEAEPTAIYIQPEGLTILEEEERMNQRRGDSTVVAGVKVTGLMTGGGVIPFIDDWALGPPVPSATETGKTDYTAVIVTEPLIEYQYITSAEPRLFLLGLQNSLASQYICVMFGGVVFKGKADTNVPEINAVSYAHSVVTFTK